MDIIKTVIPSAGLGTRFLPFTKAIPKEMLPVLNKPALQCIVEEALASDIHNFLIVTGRGKEAIAEHFDPSLSLEVMLKERDKSNLLTALDRIARLGHFTYIRQSEALGLGHAVLMAQHSIGKEYFGIMLPDDIIVAKQPGLGQLIRVARQEKATVIAVQEVPTEQLSSYGVIGIKKQITPNLFQISHIIEKPHLKDAPSNLAVVGRYVISHKIFASLENVSSSAFGELQLSDGINHLIHQSERVFAYKIQGTRYDLGTPLGFIKATIGCALQDPEYGPQVRKFLGELSQENPLLYNPAKQTEYSL